ncbi:hypothetical protein PT974_10245 [Cladobotryum mycophilum]|uniref:Uncharacterized protein n=1 Tax=Cladobotryum mycophilum TaxID=491253 RepID=A0ABR0SA85_9HYPO
MTANPKTDESKQSLKTEYELTFASKHIQAFNITYTSLAKSSSPQEPAVQQSRALHRTSRKGPDAEDLQPWTAARCQRLLRQLQARLAALRRLKHQRISEHSTKSKRDSDDGAYTTSKRIRLTYSQKDKPSIPVPQDSAITTPPRPIRTLGTMRLGHSSPVSGPADFRTPVWKRIRGRTDTPRNDCDQTPILLEEEPPTEVPSIIMDEMLSFRQLVPDAQYRLYEAIFDWINGLLRSTAPRARQVHTKSLLAMCLRKVPACIANIEAWDRQQSRDKRAGWNSSLITFDMYDQLEEFGPEGVGWRPLIFVVRSQVIKLLSDAISEGYLHPSFTGLLIRLCVHLNCNEEAVRIACSMQGILPEPRNMKSSLAESKYLQPLYSLLLPRTEDEKVPGAVFECVSTFFEEQRLPLMWLSTRGLSRLWTSSLEHMASSNAKPSVLKFMQTAMISLARCSQSQQKLDQCNTVQTLIGIAAGVVTTALTLESEIGTRQGSQREKAWRRLLHVLDYSIAHIRRPNRRRGGYESGFLILVLARCLVVANSGLADVNLRRQAVAEFEAMAVCIDAASKRDVQYHQMILLICTVAQCRRRTCAIPGHDSLSEICSKLHHLHMPDWFSKAVQKDVAFMFAQKTKDLRDLAFAESLPAASESLNISTMFSGWRWEEGISEWVLPDSEADTNQPKTKTVGGLKQDGCEMQSKNRDSTRTQSRKGQSLAITKRTTTLSSIKSKSLPHCTWAAVENRPSLRVSSNKNNPKGPSLRKRVRPALAMLAQSRGSSNDWDDLL